MRIHALTARAVRESLTADELARAAGAAAALLEVWPDILWDPDGRPVLFRAGTSLLDTGLAAPAITY
ncbi:hypothetical protein ACIRPN_09070 [Streptomyces sp. NPDC101230]|uniref:hypothetical protein n=1 Tax=unclassified Streptomyces TaxID=2593676 RepID=UPI0038016E27